MLEALTAFLDSFFRFGVPGFDLAVYRDGRPFFRYHNGFRDVDKTVAMDGTERYNIYSCSKGITCTAALQLWEKGLFSLEDRLSDYMPEFRDMTVATENGVKKAENPILIRHLFEMTAGFSYDTRSPELMRCRAETNGRCPTRETMRYLAKEPLLFEPGDRFHYSLCHDVLAALVEVVANERFGTYVQKNIFDVADMSRSTFLLPEEEIGTICPQYTYDKGVVRDIGRQISSYKFGDEYESGGAGCISTVDDYVRFIEALRTGRLLSPETLAMMATDRLTEYQKRTYSHRETHGFGLGVRCPKGDARFTDFGWGGAAGAYWTVDVGKRLSVYFGMHVTLSPVQGMRTLIYRFLNAELFGADDLEDIKRDLHRLHGYDLTY